MYIVYVYMCLCVSSVYIVTYHCIIHTCIHTFTYLAHNYIYILVLITMYNYLYFLSIYTHLLTIHNYLYRFFSFLLTLAPRLRSLSEQDSAVFPATWADEVCGTSLIYTHTASVYMQHETRTYRYKHYSYMYLCVCI